MTTKKRGVFHKVYKQTKQPTINEIKGFNTFNTFK